MAAGNRVPRDVQEALALMRGVLAREPRGGEVSELMAMTQAALGQCGEAVTWQREALAAAERLSRPDLVRRLTETLARYERRQPCRTLALDEAWTNSAERVEICPLVVSVSNHEQRARPSTCSGRACV